MRRRFVWIQGGSVYQLTYAFTRNGVLFTGSNTATGLIQLSNPAPPFDQTFDLTENVSNVDLTVLQNEQSVIEAIIEASNVAGMTRSYRTRNQLSVDASMRLEQLSNTSNASPFIFVRAAVLLFRVSPVAELLAQQELFVYGNDPVGTVRTWSGTLTAP